MSKKKKALIISLSTVAMLIILLIILCFTAFSLKSVEIDFRTSTENITSTKQEIIESGKFRKGKSVFFHKKNGYIKKLENFNPYIKVINIETVFPSKFVVHLVERQEIYAIKCEEGHYICDEELRVLRIDDNYKSSPSSPILLETHLPLRNSYSVGTYIDEVEKPNIYRYFYENNRKLGEQKAMIEKITLSEIYDPVVKEYQMVATLKFYSGQTFKIVNIDYGMKNKVQLLLSVFAQMHDFIGKEIKIDDEKTAILTEENLKTCTIVISNYYDKTKYAEKDCYFNILLEEDGESENEPTIAPTI